MRRIINDYLRPPKNEYKLERSLWWMDRFRDELAEMVYVRDQHDLFKTYGGGEHHRVRHFKRHRLAGAAGEPLVAVAFPHRLPGKRRRRLAQAHRIDPGRRPRQGQHSTQSHHQDVGLTEKIMRKNMLEALSDNIVIDKDKCTYCGICVETCILDNLRLNLAPCRQGCPLGVNVQGYVQEVLRGRDDRAREILRETLIFPEILGRICTAPCEARCHRKTTGETAVAARAIKRYLTDRPDGRRHPGARD